MKVSTQTATYPRNQCAPFMRSREKHGQLSNMTFGYPLSINGINFQGPEGLYQALKYPGSPNTQKAIASQRSGMEAKKTAYGADTAFRPDWDEVRITAMAWTIATKLRQHPETFGQALARTGHSPIVEMSYRDTFWGARPHGDYLTGANVLGKLLTGLRTLYREHCADPAAAADAFLHGLDLRPLIVNGAPVSHPPDNPARAEVHRSPQTEEPGPSAGNQPGGAPEVLGKLSTGGTEMTTSQTSARDGLHPEDRDAADLQGLFEAHKDILQQAVSKRGFRHQMPEGAQEAIRAGLVMESDPTWMYSDDSRASNGFALTELGIAVTEGQGWTCACAGHRRISDLNGVRVTPAIDGMCPGCKSSANQYGLDESEGKPSCKMCAVRLQYKRDQQGEEKP